MNNVHSQKHFGTTWIASFCVPRVQENSDTVHQACAHEQQPLSAPPGTVWCFCNSMCNIYGFCPRYMVEFHYCNEAN